MPKGPHEARLDGYVTGGNVATIRHSAHVWESGHNVLINLATALESAKPQLLDRFGPQTGPAAVKAFQKVADNVRAQANEMKKASTALGTAGDALEDAQTTHHKLGNAPASPPADPTQKAGETSEDFHSRQKTAHAAQGHYATETAERERQSLAATHDVDTKYDHAIKVMESIHGQPRRTSGSGTGTGSGTIPGGGVAPPGHHGSINPPPHVGINDPHPWYDPTGHDHGPGGHDHDPGGHDHDPGTIDDPPHYGDPGSPQGPGSYPTPGPGSTPPGAGLPPSGGNLPTGPTSTAIGGLISGGIVGGTSGLTGAMRTSAMSALTAEEQAALSASRTSRSGATGVASGAGRGGAVGRSGGSRGGGGGAGAGGRGGRGRKKKRPDATDFFENNEDWLDDDEAAPGVLG
jgi:hypothetical protein